MMISAISQQSRKRANFILPLCMIAKIVFSVPQGAEVCISVLQTVDRQKCSIDINSKFMSVNLSITDLPLTYLGIELLLITKCCY